MAEAKKAKFHDWRTVRAKKVPAARLARLDAQADHEVVEMELRAIRELAGFTQVEVAKALDLSQAEVSRAERRNDHLLSTLRQYVEALGGEIEVLARFGDKTVRLRGV